MSITLTVENTINTVIEGEIKELINYQGAPYIKFQLIATAIEFLGACLDQHSFSDHKRSETRFNKALTELFPRKYHKYAKSDAAINLFEDFRCGMIHKLSPLSNRIRLTEKKNLSAGENINMTEIDGKLYIVLEDIYDDLYKACETLKARYRKRKLPTKKMEQNYIDVSNNSTGYTQDDISVEK